jgi:hypothetical protein
MAEEESTAVQKWVCRRKRHWIPTDRGRSRRRWVVGQIYEGTDTPPEEYFELLNPAQEKADQEAAAKDKFMVPQTLHEQQLLDMQTKAQVVSWIKSHYPEEAKELDVSDSMKRFDLNHLAFKLLRKA